MADVSDPRLADRRRGRHRARSGRVERLVPAFATGWWFGFGYFLAGLWWIGSAFLVEADKFGWLMPFAVFLVPAGLALFWGLGAALAQLLWSEDWRRVFALALGLGAAEWARGTVLTGFPVELDRLRADGGRSADAVRCAASVCMR